MANTFFIGDLHLGHQGIVKFTLEDDSSRPYRGFEEMIELPNDPMSKFTKAPVVRYRERFFESIEEHDELIISRWNDVVKPQDKVYLLGDAVINRRNIGQLARLNGKITLVMGNHDCFRPQEYMDAGIADLKGSVHMGKENWILTHIPVHPRELTRFKMNLHGHLHRSAVKEHSSKLYDLRYMCLSVESINNMMPQHMQFAPVELSDIKMMLEGIDL